MTRLDNDEKLTLKILTSGQRRKVWLVNEPGLYSLMLRSSKPGAKKFKRWITHKVLPSIHKDGGYHIDETKQFEKVLNNPTKMLGLIERYTKKVLLLEGVNKELQPKADGYELPPRHFVGPRLRRGKWALLQNKC